MTNVVIYSAERPLTRGRPMDVPLIDGDMWIDMTDGRNTPHRHEGGVWRLVTDDLIQSGAGGLDPNRPRP